VVTLAMAPPIQVGQEATVIIGGREFPVPRATKPQANVEITIKKASATVKPLPLRVRVDRVETILVADVAAMPPRFDPAQAITIT